MAFPGDDDVILHQYAQLITRCDDFFCHVDISIRWCGITRRMIVQEPFSSRYPSEKQYIFTHLFAVRARCLGAVLCAPA